MNFGMTFPLLHLDLNALPRILWILVEECISKSKYRLQNIPQNQNKFPNKRELRLNFNYFALTDITHIFEILGLLNYVIFSQYYFNPSKSRDFIVNDTLDIKESNLAVKWLKSSKNAK